MSTLKSIALMETETAESIEAVISPIQIPKLGARPRTRLVCRWEQDQETGKLYCVWSTEPCRRD